MNKKEEKSLNGDSCQKYVFYGISESFHICVVFLNSRVENMTLKSEDFTKAKNILSKIVLNYIPENKLLKDWSNLKW